MLIIGEIHHVLAGPLLKQRHFLNVIKYMGNEHQIPIVAAGTHDAFNAIQIDPQLANRFEPALLPRWSMNEDYLRLLASFEPALRLEQRSNLIDPVLATKILTLSGGTIGEISTLLTRSAVRAIDDGNEELRLDIVVERCHENLTFFATVNGKQFVNRIDGRIDIAECLSNSRVFFRGLGLGLQHRQSSATAADRAQPPFDRIPRLAVRSPKRNLIVIWIDRLLSG
jgi:hypothetical protein